jgi:hypothetical protein
MSSATMLKYWAELEQASDGCCGTATGLAFSHPVEGQRGSRYFVDTKDPSDVSIQRTAGEPQALDELPEVLALNIVGAWIRHGNVNPLASKRPRVGEPTECTVK